MSLSALAAAFLARHHATAHRCNPLDITTGIVIGAVLVLLVLMLEAHL